jgi:hypothetical protein
MTTEYYILALFPSGYREVMCFDTEAKAKKQAQKYANAGAYHTSLTREVTTHKDTKTLGVSEEWIES